MCNCKNRSNRGGNISKISPRRTSAINNGSIRSGRIVKRMIK